MVSVIYGIGVQALGDSDCAGMEEKHRKPVLRASRAGARRTLVANISSPRLGARKTRLRKRELA